MHAAQEAGMQRVSNPSFTDWMRLTVLESPFGSGAVRSGNLYRLSVITNASDTTKKSIRRVEC
jgi:hypothetical protein